MYELVGSKDKTLKLCRGLLYEIFNAPEHQRIVSDMTAWPATRL